MPLDGAVAHAHGPRRSVVVGYDLHLNVPGTLHQLFHENGCIPKGLKRFGARAFQCPGKLVGGVHTSNSVSATSGCGFDQEWIAETFGMAQGILDGLDRAAAPRRNRHLRQFSQTLGGNLVTQAAHGFTVWPDEYNAHLAAEVRKIRMLGHKAPSHPHCVRACARRSPSSGMRNRRKCSWIDWWMDQ